jgi:hypothetical protein
MKIAQPHPSRIVCRFGLLFLLFGVVGLAFGQHQLFEGAQGVSDFDSRTAWVEPTPQQVGLAAQLGTVRWNHFGTPQSLINYGGYLATGLSNDPVAAASSFISSNAALFRLSATGLQNLRLLADNQMAASQDTPSLSSNHSTDLRPRSMARSRSA